MRKPRKTVQERTGEMVAALANLRRHAKLYAERSDADTERWLVSAAFELVSKARAFAKQGAKDES
jgi:hypothetical protein